MKTLKIFILLSLVVLVSNNLNGQDSTAIAYVDYSKIRSEHPGIQRMHQQFLTEVAQIKQEYSLAYEEMDSIAKHQLVKSQNNKKEVKFKELEQLRRDKLKKIKQSRSKYLSEVKFYENKLQYVIKILKKTHGFNQVKNITEFDAKVGRDITQMVVEGLANLSRSEEKSE